MKMNKLIAILLFCAIVLSSVPMSVIAEAAGEGSAVTVEAVSVEESAAQADPASEELPAAGYVVDEAQTAEEPLPDESAPAAEPVEAAPESDLLPIEAAPVVEQETISGPLEEPASAETLYPWTGMADDAFDDYIRNPENAGFLKAILAETRSEICRSLQERVKVIADPALREAIEDYLTALTAPAAVPIETAADDEPTEETDEQEAGEVSSEEVAVTETEEAATEESTGLAEEAPIGEPAESVEEIPAEEPSESEEEALTGEVEEASDETGSEDPIAEASPASAEQEPEFIAAPSLGVPEDAVAEEISTAIDEEVSAANATYSGTCGFDLRWSLYTDTGKLTITGTGPMTSWSSESSVPWYSYRSQITSVVLPQGITSIGSNAFYDCGNLTGISIPASVTVLGDFAFKKCTGLTRVDITDLVAWCRLDHNYGESNPLYYAHNLYLNGNLVTNAVIPGSVGTIGRGAFWGCYSLTSVTIDNGVTNINHSAFRDCWFLTNITIADSVTNIGISTFSGCRRIRSITIPNSVTTIDNWAFQHCSSLASITIPNSVTSIGKAVFGGCCDLNSITLPFVGSSRTATGSNSLFGYIFGTSSFTGGTATNQYYTTNTYTTYYIPQSLRSVTLTDTTRIPFGAFNRCSNLTSLSIPASVTSIGQDCFYGCTSLNRVNITDIAAWCGIDFADSYHNGYYGYSNPLCYAHNLYLNGSLVTDLVIPEGVTGIGRYAFYGCSLTSVTVPGSLTTVGNHAFSACRGLERVNITNLTGWTQIRFANLDANPVSFCGNLYLNNVLVKDLVIPAGVTSIGSMAFNACSLTSVTIPASVNSIGSFAFNACRNLTDVYYGGSQNQWEAISISSYNDPLKNAERHYESSGQALTSFVTRLYGICLGRAPGASELSYYVSQLTAGTTTGVTVACNFVFSNEFKAKNLCDNHYVTYLYRVFFDREPGASELSYHAGRLSSGAKREDIFNGFAMSGEYRALCESYGIAQGAAIGVPASGTVPTGSCTAPGCATAAPAAGVNAFVERLYAICLGRNAAASEVSYYAKLLNAHTISGTNAAWNFFNSSEYQSRNRTNRQYIIDLYKVLLGRDPAEAEITYHAGRLASGALKVDIFNGFSQSREFLNICSSYGIERGSAISVL